MFKKVTENGRDVTGKYRRKTLLESIAAQFKPVWYWTKIVMGIGLGGAMVGGLIVGLSIGSITKYTKAEEVQVPVYVDTMPQKIEALKDEVVKDLESCESAGHTEDDAIVILDNNKAGTLKRKDIPSFGVLQFKVSTVQHYKKLIDGETLTNKQAVLLALEAAEARELAKSIIFETDGGIQNWVNCSKKHGLVDKVRIIKAITK